MEGRKEGRSVGGRGGPGGDGDGVGRVLVLPCGCLVVDLSWGMKGAWMRMRRFVVSMMGWLLFSK